VVSAGLLFSAVHKTVKRLLRSEERIAEDSRSLDDFSVIERW